MEKARDKALASYASIESGKAKAPALRPLAKGLASLTDTQRALVRACVAHAVDATLHGLLFGLVEQNDFGQAIRVIVDEKNAAELSDGLEGEAYGDDGWIARFSAFDEKGIAKRPRQAP